MRLQQWREVCSYSLPDFDLRRRASAAPSHLQWRLRLMPDSGAMTYTRGAGGISLDIRSYMRLNRSRNFGHVTRDTSVMSYEAVPQRVRQKLHAGVHAKSAIEAREACLDRNLRETELRRHLLVRQSVGKHSQERTVSARERRGRRGRFARAHLLHDRVDRRFGQPHRAARDDTDRFDEILLAEREREIAIGALRDELRDRPRI